MKRHLQALLFDLDELLHASQEFLEFAYPKAVHAMMELGLNAQNGAVALQKLWEIYDSGKNTDDHFDQLCLQYGNTRDGGADPLIVAAGVHAYHIAKLTIQPPLALDAVLEQLSRQYSSPSHLGLGVVSNGKPKKQAEKLILNKIVSYFVRHEHGKVVESAIFCSDDPAIAKPNLTLLERAQAQMGFRYGHAVMTGDRIYADVLPGNLVGMYTVHIRQGKYADETPEAAREKYRRQFPEREVPPMEKFVPYATITSVTELPDVIIRIERELRQKERAACPETQASLPFAPAHALDH